MASLALLGCGSPRGNGQSRVASAAEGSSATILSPRTSERTSSQAFPKTGIDFELQDLSGKPVKLSDYRGKVVLVNFWASWCGPCEFEIPVFLKMRRQYQKRGFEVIGISMDEGSLEQLAEFIKQLKINYPVVLGASANLEMFGPIKGLPTSFLIDREGRIHRRYQGLLGLNEIENELAKLMAAK